MEKVLQVSQIRDFKTGKLPYFPLKDEKTMKSIDAKKKMCIM